MAIELDLQALVEFESVWQKYNRHSREHVCALIDAGRRPLAQIEQKISDKRLELDQIDVESAGDTAENVRHQIAQLDRARDDVLAALLACQHRLQSVDSTTRTAEIAGVGELRRMHETAKAYLSVNLSSDHAIGTGSAPQTADASSVTAAEARPTDRLPKGFVWVNLETISVAAYELSDTDRRAHFQDDVMAELVQSSLPRVSQFVTDRGFIDYDRIYSLDQSEGRSATNGIEAAARAFFGDEPIVLDGDGPNAVINGRHRLRLAAQLGLRYVPVRQL